MGLSRQLEQRWAIHRLELRRGRHPNRALQDDWLVFGADAFRFEILEAPLDADLESREAFWYLQFRDRPSGVYNRNDPVTGGPARGKQEKRAARLRQTSSTPDADGYLTVAEAATRLRVSEERIRRWLRAGELRGVRYAKRTGWRISERDLAAFVRARQNRPPTEAHDGSAT